jgi:hypothetical protein
MTEIPRGTVIGKRDGGQPTDEAEHFFKFEMCGDWFDMRDLGAVLDQEEPLPPYSMRSNVVVSQVHQRGVVRRRRDEPRTLRLRSSRAPTMPVFRQMGH